MTAYLCSTCGEVHDNSSPGCPQEFTLTNTGTAEQRPVVPPGTPSWAQRYVCPQCLPELQPRNGFGLVEFTEHVFSHSVVHLQEAARDAGEFREALEAIEHAVNDLRGWPPHALRKFIAFHVNQGLRRRDDTWIEKWQRDYETAPDQCSACGQKVTKERP